MTQRDALNRATWARELEAVNAAFFRKCQAFQQEILVLRDGLHAQTLLAQSCSEKFAAAEITFAEEKKTLHAEVLRQRDNLEAARAESQQMLTLAAEQHARREASLLAEKQELLTQVQSLQAELSAQQEVSSRAAALAACEIAAQKNSSELALRELQAELERAHESGLLLAQRYESERLDCAAQHEQELRFLNERLTSESAGWRAERHQMELSLTARVNAAEAQTAAVEQELKVSKQKAAAEQSSAAQARRALLDAQAAVQLEVAKLKGEVQAGTNLAEYWRKQYAAAQFESAQLTRELKSSAAQKRDLQLILKETQDELLKKSRSLEAARLLSQAIESARDAQALQTHRLELKLQRISRLRRTALLRVLELRRALAAGPDFDKLSCQDALSEQTKTIGRPSSTVARPVQPALEESSVGFHTSWVTDGSERVHALRQPHELIKIWQKRAINADAERHWLATRLSSTERELASLALSAFAGRWSKPASNTAYAAVSTIYFDWPLIAEGDYCMNSYTNQWESALNAGSEPVPAHLDTLLALPGEIFIDATYRAVLGREPDAEGRAFFCQRLLEGVGKLQIVKEFAESPEAKSAGRSLPGLSAALLRENAKRRGWRYRVTSFFGLTRVTDDLQLSLNRIQSWAEAQVLADRRQVLQLRAELEDLKQRQTTTGLQVTEVFEESQCVASRLAVMQQDISRTQARARRSSERYISGPLAERTPLSAAAESNSRRSVA